MNNDAINFYNNAFSNLLSINSCYFTALIALTITLIGFAVVKYFIDWNRVDKKLKKGIKETKDDIESFYIQVTNKWIRSFVLKGNDQYEENPILRLLNNEFAIETINEIYPNINDEDFLFYTKTIRKHITKDLDLIKGQTVPFEKNDRNETIIQNLENDLCILCRKDKSAELKDLLDYVKSFNNWIKEKK